MKQNRIVIAIAVGILLIAGIIFFPKINIADNNGKAESTKVVQKSNLKKQSNKKEKKAAPYKDPKDLRPEGTWKKKSEKKAHPNLIKIKNLWIRVSLKGNRTYVMSGKKPVYTMLSTAGLYHNGKSDTPTGTYYIQDERGQKFYNDKLNEGARYYVSWKDHGIYLFHSVPTKYGDKIDVKEAKKLGKTQGSHGCVRLSLPDAKWLMYNIPYGTKVVVKDY